MKLHRKVTQKHQKRKLKMLTKTTSRRLIQPCTSHHNYYAAAVLLTKRKPSLVSLFSTESFSKSLSSTFLSSTIKEKEDITSGSNNGISRRRHTHHDAKKNKNTNRPMVHLSSAPNIKFTGKKIGSSHPIIPHPITPQKRIVVNDDCAVSGSSTSTCSSSPFFPPYAIQGRIVNDNQSKNHGNITIHDKDTIQKIRNACQFSAQMLQTACEIAGVALDSGDNNNIGTMSLNQDGQEQKFMTTDELDDIIHNKIVNYNQTYNEENENKPYAYPSPLNYNHFPKSICCSINEVICHGIPDTRELQNGDLLSIDISVYLNGVHGDSCSSIIVGGYNDDNDDNNDSDEVLEQKERAQNLINATREAMYRAIDVCVQGTPLNHIGNAVHDVADEYGYRPVKNVCGHGIGTELHMLPQVKV